MQAVVHKEEMKETEIHVDVRRVIQDAMGTVMVYPHQGST